MKVLIVGHSEVARLLPMADCMAAVSEALAALARGEAALLLRHVVRLPEGVFAAMPGYVAPLEAVGVKAISVFPGNLGTEYESHQGAVLLFEARRGRLLAVVDAIAITAIRTAAVSAVATRLLAREDAGDLAILGTGVQAGSHLEAMGLVRSLRRVRVFSPDPGRRRAFAERASARHHIPVEAVATARDAVAGADIICTVTAAREPVLQGDWIAPGAHVNAVGACMPECRELDTAAVLRSRFFVDRRESALNEAGDLLIPKREGALRDDHIRGEIGELLTGRAQGRTAGEDVTVFESLGLAVEDVASAHVVYRNAMARGEGTWVELGGAPDAAG